MKPPRTIFRIDQYGNMPREWLLFFNGLSTQVNSTISDATDTDMILSMQGTGQITEHLQARIEQLGSELAGVRGQNAALLARINDLEARLCMN